MRAPGDDRGKYLIMDDEMRIRRRNAALAFIQRRGELGLTQEDVATRADVAYRTVQNFEHGVWPNPVTRARLEKAVSWPAGEISRLGSPPQPYVDPQLLDRVSELSDEERKWMIGWLTRSLRRREDRPSAAEG